MSKENVTEIKDAISEAETKKEEIKINMDKQEDTNNATGLKNIKLRINKKEYELNQLLTIMNKQKKTLEEFEITKQFKSLMKNYYEGIAFAILNVCCGKTFTINDVKKKLQQDKTYELIDIRCSKKTIKFDRETVDTVIKFAETYLV